MFQFSYHTSLTYNLSLIAQIFKLEESNKGQGQHHLSFSPFSKEILTKATKDQTELEMFGLKEELGKWA